jgi:lactate dehydrogenase-like 2-hydroxyacid dehydrogenase
MSRLCRKLISTGAEMTETQLMKNALLLTSRPTENVLKEIEKSFRVIGDGEEPLSTDRLIELAAKNEVVAVMVLMGQKVDAATVAQLPQSVKIVATVSVGYDHLDIGALQARGIAVTNTPDVLSDATADLAFLLMLGAARRLPDYFRITSKGWGKTLGQAELLGTDLKGKRLGILGMGRIGQAFASRARAFGMDILYCNLHRLPPGKESGARYFADFHALLKESDVLSLHAPATKETENIMGAKEFAMLPPGAIFVNVARGTLVDEAALINALKSKHLFAAGIDVCRNQPNPNPEFATLSNLLFTPHVGSATRETRDAMGFRALENIQIVLRGEKPRDQLHPQF